MSSTVNNSWENIMDQKNLIIICITAILCVAILSFTILFLNSEDNGVHSNNSSNDSITITLNDSDNVNNTTAVKTKKSTKKTKKKESSESDDDEEWYDIVVPGTEGKETVRAKHDQLTEYGNRYITEDGNPIYV